MLGILWHVAVITFTAVASPPRQADISVGAAPNVRDPESLIGSGTWTGSFLQTDWTFEFRKVGSDWNGRYMSSKGNRWHPLGALDVSKTDASFSIVSKPAMIFALRVDPAGEQLAGTVTIEGVATAPFTATRR